jgi:amidase
MTERFLLVATRFLAAVTPVLAIGNHKHDSHHGTNADVDVDTLVDSQVLTDPYAYDFPRLNTNGADLFPMRPCKGHQLLEASIDEIQDLLSAGELTSVDLVHCYLERIYQTDSYLKSVMISPFSISRVHTQNFQSNPPSQPRRPPHRQIPRQRTR